MMTRRQAIKTTALASAAIATVPGAFAQQTVPPTQQPLISTNVEPFTLPTLPYAYDALEPFIDAQTMQIHHDKHHAAYVANLNKALAEWPEYRTRHYSGILEQNLRALDSFPENIRTAVRNNGGGHYNHSLFWQMMKKGGTLERGSELEMALSIEFGSFGAFKEKFTKAALGQFGSGWAWLVLDGKQLKIEPTANQDTPLSAGRTPLLGVDVWEHAYYLKYQNKRADYIGAWFNVVNWDFVAERYAQFKS